jgi:hypothetical protein
MIVREILQDPFAIVANFDWFNDYRDTRRFLVDHGGPETPALLAFLDAGNTLWWKLNR